MMEVGDRVTVSVRKIANGFLVTETKDKQYRSGEGEPLFYPTIEGVEAELVFHFRAAMNLGVSEVDF